MTTPAQTATRMLKKLGTVKNGKFTSYTQDEIDASEEVLMFARAYYATAKQFLPVPEIADPILKRYAYQLGYYFELGKNSIETLAKMETERAARDENRQAMRPMTHPSNGAKAATVEAG